MERVASSVELPVWGMALQCPWGATLGMGGGGDTVTTSSGADVGMGVAGGDGMGDAVDGGIGVFEAFLESMRDPDTSETIDVILQGYQVFCESVVDAKVKPGKMHRILDIDPSESIESDPRYSTPRKLASALKEKVGYAKAMKMLTFAANIKSGDQFMDKAKSALEKMGE